MEREQLAAVVKNLLDSRAENKSLSTLVHYLHSTLYSNLEKSNSIVSDLIDPEFFDDIKNLNGQKDIQLYFGKSLRHLKCVLPSEGGLREIDIFIEYKGPRKIRVTDANLPRTPLQDREFISLKELVYIYDIYIDSLAQYFCQLERIDRFCTVVEPANPTFREHFRRILLEERTWLNVNVTPKGFATNIHLLGNSEQLNEKLQVGLLHWDHDIDIVENITAVFDIWHYANAAFSPAESLSSDKTECVKEVIVCSICLCRDVPDAPSLPQPLCLNHQCEAYFHRNCLFEWLVASSGGRPPAFGVAIGNCPACLEHTTCHEMDA